MLKQNIFKNIYYLRDVFKKKKKLLKFSIKLGGWILDAPVFHKEKTNIVLKHFILPVEYFKANLFFSEGYRRYLALCLTESVSQSVS